MNNLGGFDQGHRNDGMYNVAVYLRKKYPDNWEKYIQQYNVKMCKEPVDLQELNALVKSVKRKNYTYRCKQQPIAPYCHRSLCLTRSCGVGEAMTGGGAFPELGNLTKYVSDPVLWFVEVDGHRLMFQGDELLNQAIFRRKVMDSAVNRVIGAVPGPRWFSIINEKIQSAEVIEVPDDASPVGQFKLLVDEFTKGQARATSKEELAHRMTPLRTGMGEIMFRSRGLLDYLTNHGFKFKSEHHVWQMLRDMGATTHFMNIKGVGFNVWVLPDTKEVEEDVPLPEFGTKEF